MPAISNKILTSPAGIGWSISRKIHCDGIPLMRSRLVDFAGSSDVVDFQVVEPRTGSTACNGYLVRLC